MIRASRHAPRSSTMSNWMKQDVANLNKTKKVNNWNCVLLHSENFGCTPMQVTNYFVSISCIQHILLFTCYCLNMDQIMTGRLPMQQDGPHHPAKKAVSSTGCHHMSHQHPWMSSQGLPVAQHVIGHHKVCRALVITLGNCHRRFGHATTVQVR